MPACVGVGVGQIVGGVDVVLLDATDDEGAADDDAADETGPSLSLATQMKYPDTNPLQSDCSAEFQATSCAAVTPYAVGLGQHGARVRPADQPERRAVRGGAGVLRLRAVGVVRGRRRRQRAGPRRWVADAVQDAR